jgi:tetratricopeptide (TPR) repeat protein
MKPRASLLVLSFATALSASAAPLPAEVADLAHEWERIKYQMPKDQRAPALAALAEHAAKNSVAHAGSAPALVWEAIILSSEAGEKGGLGALSLVKKAKQLLEKAEGIEPNALDGSVYTSLGSLYYQVPGWPIGFGNTDKAREYLKRALAANPDGMDANYFYGDFLMEQGDYPGAVTAFEKALSAPARPDRPLGDSGRREETRSKLAEAQKRATSQTR